MWDRPETEGSNVSAQNMPLFAEGHQNPVSLAQQWVSCPAKVLLVFSVLWAFLGFRVKGVWCLLPFTDWGRNQAFFISKLLINSFQTEVCSTGGCCFTWWRDYQHLPCCWELKKLLALGADGHLSTHPYREAAKTWLKRAKRNLFKGEQKGTFFKQLNEALVKDCQGQISILHRIFIRKVNSLQHHL